MNWIDEDAAKGKEVFDWLVKNAMCDAGALVFADCIMFAKNEEWTFELPGPDLETVCRLFAEGNREKLLPLLKKLDEEEYSKANFIQDSQLALCRWERSSYLQLDPPAPQSALPSSGEWLEFLGIELSDEDEEGIDKCQLGMDFQRWRRDVQSEGGMSFREWVAPQLPGYAANKKLE